jgi:pimeloyl-ACP methyl ester carboxylesterase
VLLLHGFLDNAWTWEALAGSGFAPAANLVAPDWRGHGDSDWIGAGGYYHFLDYVADLAALVAALAPRRLSIVAHSMGGTVASYYAGTFPDRVERLVLIEGLVAPEGLLEPGRIARWIDGWLGARARRNRGYASLEEASARLRETDPELDEARARRLAERGVRRDAGGQLRFKHDPLHTTRAPYPFTFDAAERFWRAITAPVLLVDGARSPFRLPADEAARRRSAFTDVRQVVIEGTGHSPHRHRPAEVGRLIAEHLER